MITVKTRSAKEAVDNRVYQELKKLETDDFQNRGDNYPRSGVPVDISCDEHDIAFSFKNTSIRTAVSYVERYLTSKGFKVSNVKGFQDGDYVDDWVTAYVLLSDISLPGSASTEAFKGHIDNVEELRQALLKWLPESGLWDNLGKKDELHCLMPATKGLNIIKSTVLSILANSVLDADVKVEEAKGSKEGWVYVSITKIKENPNAMQAFEQAEDLRGWGDEEIANQNALSSIAEALKNSFDASGIKYGALDYDIFDTGSTICIQGVENPQEVIEFLEEHFEFPIVDEGENYVVIDTIQEYEDSNGETQTRVNTNYLTNEEPDEDAKKLARIKEEIYYYLGREVSDEEALEVLDFAEAKPDTDLSAIVSDYFNQ